MKSLLKLTPICVIAGLMLSGMDILIAAPLSFMYASLVAMIVDRFKFQECLDAALENLKHFLIVFLILELAYAVAECFMSTGVAASVINISLAAGLNAKSVAVVAFLLTCVLSTATGTSWGTFAACAPIFLWLNHIVGGNTLLTIGAIAGGSCFGDNIGLISDTTIVSSGIQQVEVIKRVRHQGVWSLLCLVSGAVIFYLASLGLSEVTAQASEAIAQIPEEVWQTLGEERPSAVTLLKLVKTGVPYYLVIPLVIVIATAVKGYSTLICLASGIISSLIFGFIAGTVTSLSGFFEVIYTGFSDAGGWSIAMMLWVGAFGGVMRLMNAFDPVAVLVARVVRKVRHLMFANSLLCLLGNAALSDEMAQIVTIGPIIKNITEENIVASKEDMYTLALRNATFSDAMGVLGSQLIPWHCYMGFFLGISASVYPLASGITAGDIISHNYFSMIAVASMLILTFTGWDRYIPLFKLPEEPKVYLKNDAAKYESR
ncbi:MAG: Na+/H+ antiporter NhaC family protein [Synergistes jonesii]|uniref:Na+/H+ antiporter NhaC family protein n=1 Tax=Synergistes jonesii TaxID=2754 RepID=UPI002A7633A0|nr:Na+/H+ antiporter NhaC family protein [Synergistes jonesii]MDY2984378.1 Na+/H+ antiporter NhaC family protein [Synergistes jonesii]